MSAHPVKGVGALFYVGLSIKVFPQMALIKDNADGRRMVMLDKSISADLRGAFIYI
jgi:hypothetical protein